MMEKESERIGEDRNSTIISVDHQKKMTAIQGFYIPSHDVIYLSW